MPNLNRVFLIGNVVRNPDLRYTPKGTAIAELGLAINRVRTDDEGHKIEEVTFVDVTLWARQAEIASQYLRKGSPVFIEGRLHFESWEKDGKKFSKLRVVGENVQLLRSVNRQDAEPPSRGPVSAQPAGSTRTAPVRAPSVEPDIDTF